MSKDKKQKSQPQPRPKSPEQLLRAYFHKQEIAFKYKEVKVDLPPGLAHKFVLPDFYLPELKIAVEYMEYWDDPRFRPRLLEKRELYQHAVIPCIFIYPKDLQDLGTVFPQRLQEAQRHLALQQQDAQDIRFSLMVAVVCILLGVPLSMLRYTKYLGWIAIAYGTVLLFMRHPKLVLALLKRTVNGIARALRIGGAALLIFLKALGRGLARLIVLIVRGTAISAKVFWKLAKLVAIYLWIALRALALAIIWIIVHLWYGVLTLIIWLWHGMVLLSYKLWRALRWSVQQLAIVLKITFRSGGKGLWLGLRYLSRGVAAVFRGVLRGFLLTIHAFGAGVYRAKHAIAEQAKARRLAQQEAKRNAREAAARVAKQAKKPQKGKRKSKAQ